MTAPTHEQIMATEQAEISGAAQEVEKGVPLGIHLAALREHMDLTQTELATALGVK